MNPLRQAFLSTLISSSGILLVNFVTGVLTARLLNPDGRGEVAALSLWAQTLGFLAALGFTEAITFLRASESSQEFGRRLLSTSVVVTLLFGTLGVGVGELILPHLLAAQSEIVVNLGRLFLLTIYLVIATETAKAMLAGDQDFRFLNLIRVAQPLLYAGTLVTLWAVHRASVPGVLLAATVTGMLSLIAIWIRLARRVGFGRPSVAILRQGLAYGIRQQGANFSRLTSARLDLLIIPAFMASASLGLYAVATNLSSLIFALLGSFSLVVFPAATKAGGAAGLPLVARTLRLVLVLGTILCLGMFLAAPLFVRVIYGESFAGTVLPLRILLPGAVLMAATSILSSGLQSLNRPQAATVAQVGGAVVTVAGLLVLLRSYGIVGAALVSTTAYGVSFFLSLLLLSRSPGFSMKEALSPAAFFRDLSALSAGRKFRALLTGFTRAAAVLPYLTLPALVALALSVSGHMPEGGYQISLLLLLVLPAVALALADARGLPVYLLAVWAVCPEIRRLFDWITDEYRPVSLLSAAPLIVTLTLLIPILRRPIALAPSLKVPLGLLCAALGYGTILGGLHNGLAFAFDLGNYAVPLLMLLYASQRSPDARERDGWLRGLAALAIGAAIYGWVQFLIAPPWDTFWMKHVEMNSIGTPLPLEIRVFSTLNAPGPAGAFFAASLAPMLLRPQWRGSLGWLGGALVASALALTLVRSSWLSLLICVAAYTLLLPGRAKGRPLLGLVGLMAALYFAAPLLPGGSGIVSRVGTLGDLGNDYSYQDRQQFSAGVFAKILANPLGMGLGSVGVGTKLDHSGQMGEYGVFDNGFFAVLMTFGIPGGLMFFGSLLRIGFVLRRESAPAAPLAALGRLALAALLAGVASLSSGNCFPGLSGMLLWFFVGLPLARPMMLQSASDDSLRRAGIGRPAIPFFLPE